MSWYSFRPYVSAAERRAKAAIKLKALTAKGLVVEPLGELSHRTKIATSFWGHAWCRHLESFSDYENRLPRGRTYVRNGSVLHLSITTGTVNALVQGSELYELTVSITPINPKTWTAIQTRCRGKIGSLLELLQGRISDEVMAIVTDQRNGLFPGPKEIRMDCNCPDWATMCKHVAAVLYGVGARLDTHPELLFTLRGVDHNDLIALDTAALAGPKRTTRRRTLDAAAINNVFGLDLDTSPTAEAVVASPAESPAPPPPATKKLPAPSTPQSPKPAKKKPKSPRAKKSASKKTAPPPFRADAINLKALRAMLGQSRTTFAKSLNIRTATLTRWEQSKSPPAIPPATQKKLNHLWATLTSTTP